MFDLSDLETPIPPTNSKHKHYWLCTSCKHVALTSSSCATCKNKDFIPFLDRRPLLLTKEIRNGIVSLIDKAADSLVDMDIEESIVCTNEYMPFLSKILKDSKIAQDRSQNGEPGWRKSSLSCSDQLALFEQSQMPPTENT